MFSGNGLEIDPCLLGLICSESQKHCQGNTQTIVRCALQKAQNNPQQNKHSAEKVQGGPYSLFLVLVELVVHFSLLRAFELMK